MEPFRDMHVVVTGGSSGIGLAVAHLLAEQGAAVSLLARGEERLNQAAARLRAGGTTVWTAAVDVSDQAALIAALDRLVDQGGPCDVLVTCAGVARAGHYLQLDDSVFRQMIEVDYFGTLHAIRALAPAMVRRGRGSIVAIASATALLGIFGYTAYAPAKYAVRGLMEALRDELHPHGVHVACVFPPDVDTPQLAEENKDKPTETFAISGAIVALRPLVVAHAIVRAIERKRFAVYPDTATALLARLGPLAAPLVRRIIDRKVHKAGNTAAQSR